MRKRIIFLTTLFICMALSAQKNPDWLKSAVLYQIFFNLKKAEGIGLAAVQINLPKRVFVIDTIPLSEPDPAVEKYEAYLSILL